MISDLLTSLVSKTTACKRIVLFILIFLLSVSNLFAQTLAFPEAMGFGRYALGARGVAASSREVYVVTNLKDNGAGSFRDAVSKPGRIVTFAVGGTVNIATDIVVSPNVTIAGQTAPGTGILILGRRVTFSSSNNTIARYLRVRYGGTAKEVDASGIANGANMIFDHMSFSWGTDEVFSINSDGKGTPIDNITLQNCIIAQGLHRHNHSASGLIQPPTGGKVSLIQNLYISNKTRNPKVKGINEFVNNVVYNWGNANRLGSTMNYGWSGEAYIMGGDSDGESFVNIINNYFVGGPSTNPSNSTPFSRGNSNFNLYGAGNYFDNNQNGVLDGNLVPYNTTGYPTGDEASLKTTPYDYPAKSPALTAQQAYQYVIDNVGSSYPRRDQVDSMMLSEVASKGSKGFYVYVPTDLPFGNGGAGNLYNAKAPIDSDSDGMPDSWEDVNGLNKNDKTDAVLNNISNPQYMNIEVYINAVTATPAPDFVTPPINLSTTAKTNETTKISSITAKWQATNNSTINYVLERSLNGTSFTVIAQPAAGTTQYIDENLNANTTYYYRVKSITATDESVYSEVSSIKTPQIPGDYDFKAGDYRTLKTGNWGSSTVTTDIWETFNGTSWSATTTPPPVTVPPATPAVTNIIIASGHQIRLNETTTVNNVIVEAGATLMAGATTGSGTAAVKTLRVSGSIVNNGIVGSSSTTTDRLTVEGYKDKGTVLISGTELYYLNNFVVNSIADTLEVVIDANLTINGYLRAPYAITGTASGQNDDEITITINQGKTVTLTTNSTAAYLHNNNATTISTTNFGNYIYTINGTLDMRATGTSCIIGHSNLDNSVTVNTNGTWLTGNAMRIVSTANPTSVGSAYFNVGPNGLVDGAARVAGSSTTTNFVFNPSTGIAKYPFFNITGKGNFKRLVTASGSSTFPVGSGGIFSPVTVSNGPTAGGFSLNVSSVDSYGKRTVEKQWTITPDFEATGVKAGLAWLTEDQVEAFDPATASIYYFSNDAWQLIPTTLTADRQGILAAPYLATLTDATNNFGTFMVANESPSETPSVLPLTLLSFKANLLNGNNKAVRLLWSTTNELNIDKFIVEKRTVGGFVSIGSVVAKNRSGNNSYMFTDENIIDKIAYYRLKVQDKNGRFTLSNIELVRLNSLLRINAYPNPASNVINVSHTIALANARLEIYNALGAKLSSTIVSTGSNYTSSIDVANLTTGLYTLVFRNGNESLALAFVKQ